MGYLPEPTPKPRKPWRCRLFGHDYRDERFGWPIPDLVLGGHPENTWYACSRCGRRTRIAFKHATGSW